MDDERLERAAEAGDDDAAQALKTRALRRGELPPVEAALERVRRAFEKRDPRLLDDLDAALGLQLHALQHNTFFALIEDLLERSADLEFEDELDLDALRAAFERWLSPRVFSVQALEASLDVLAKVEGVDDWERAWTEGGYAWRIRLVDADVEVWWDEDDAWAPGWIWVEHRPEGETVERPIDSLAALRAAALERASQLSSGHRDPRVEVVTETVDPNATE